MWATGADDKVLSQTSNNLSCDCRCCFQRAVHGAFVRNLQNFGMKIGRGTAINVDLTLEAVNSATL